MRANHGQSGSSQLKRCAVGRTSAALQVEGGARKGVGGNGVGCASYAGEIGQKVDLAHANKVTYAT